jgi:hypothetical protein
MRPVLKSLSTAAGLFRGRSQPGSHPVRIAAAYTLPLKCFSIGAMIQDYLISSVLRCKRYAAESGEFH